MTNEFRKLLLNELHMVVYQPGNFSELNDRLLCEAVTLNENLLSLGFVLKPEALAQLAVSPSLHTFFRDLEVLVPEVKAQPMYPGFPQQVMEISEAEFRMHQLMHYFSTYGVESLFGVQVSRGWLPAYQAPARTREDTILLDARVLDLVSEADAPREVLSILMARRERLTNPELDLVVKAASLCSAEQIQGLTVRFKENLDLLFPKLLEDADRETALRTLRCICSHSGDVLRCTAAYLSHKRYHLRTSEKKLLVKLLESYPVRNFRQNLMQSNMLRERNLKILQHLDYNQYSRSAEHLEAVRALRNKELLSWHAIGEELLQQHSPKALTHLAQRPGYMVRMLNRLLSLGYSQESILEVLRPQAGAISGHLILQAVRAISAKNENLDARHEEEWDSCVAKYNRMGLQYEQSYVESACRREVQQCIDRYQRQLHYLQQNLNLPMERHNCIQKFQRQRRYAQQERNNRTRQAMDIIREIHKVMEAKLLRDNLTLNKLKESSIFRRRPYLRSVAIYAKDQAGDTRKVSDSVLAEYLPAQFRNQQQELLQQIAPLEAEVDLETARIRAWLTEAQQRIQKETSEAYDDALRQIDAKEQKELAALEEKYNRSPDPYTLKYQELTRQHQIDLEHLEKQHRHRMEVAENMRKELAAKQEKKLAAIEEKYQCIERAVLFYSATVEILKELLYHHFRQAVTPLQGKKVFCDLKQFDLKHSSLQTNDRSKDGGYIRSGIAWKIPEEARYVRFFVYWDDPQRVDIDLHAGGTLTNGAHLHVGWNADFRNSGVIHSGDITHSNAAEYIDIDLNAPIRKISTNIHLYGGKSGFREVETCFVGMMAVDQIGQNVKHYSPKNCFFVHELTQNVRNLFYGFVDVQNRFVRFVGQPNESVWDSLPQMEDPFSLQDYLDHVLEAQQAEIVDSAEDADVILSMGKSLSEKGISLIDHNFFLEC